MAAPNSDQGQEPGGEDLARSAELYAEIYDSDLELRALTEQALQGWPEQDAE
ncbi:MAG TPA: hypothetical protein VML55_09855 [Planctomycetaceae bacterium]|nr:hypothetical protein [Planctomycetaceae bacterium]